MLLFTYLILYNDSTGLKSLRKFKTILVNSLNLFSFVDDVPCKCSMPKLIEIEIVIVKRY